MDCCSTQISDTFWLCYIATRNIFLNFKLLKFRSILVFKCSFSPTTYLEVIPNKKGGKTRYSNEQIHFLLYHNLSFTFAAWFSSAFWKYSSYIKNSNRYHCKCKTDRKKFDNSKTSVGLVNRHWQQFCTC